MKNATEAEITENTPVQYDINIHEPGLYYVETTPCIGSEDGEICYDEPARTYIQVDELGQHSEIEKPLSDIWSPAEVVSVIALAVIIFGLGILTSRLMDRHNE